MNGNLERQWLQDFHPDLEEEEKPWSFSLLVVA
jgi:hypothetical protein